ncbi:hypothetical protein T492DRAFT_383061 [Pavlovales sp. CCMP2436]|nr:hypothetical protein T492DRAFT_383061 [Pavlovales sp. CCMP2436]
MDGGICILFRIFLLTYPLFLLFSPFLVRSSVFVLAVPRRVARARRLAPRPPPRPTAGAGLPPGLLPAVHGLSRAFKRGADSDTPNYRGVYRRAAALQATRKAFGTQASRAWLAIAHPDEFYYHDPRAVAAGAQAAGRDFSIWWALHALPHTNDLEVFIK